MNYTRAFYSHDDEYLYTNTFELYHNSNYILCYDSNNSKFIL